MPTPNWNSAGQSNLIVWIIFSWNIYKISSAFRVPARFWNKLGKKWIFPKQTCKFQGTKRLKIPIFCQKLAFQRFTYLRYLSLSQRYFDPSVPKNMFSINIPTHVLSKSLAWIRVNACVGPNFDSFKDISDMGKCLRLCIKKWVPMILISEYLITRD